MQTIGIQADKQSLLLSLVEKTRKGAVIVALKSSSFSDIEDVKRLYSPSFQGKIISGLPTRNLLIRPLTLKGGPGRHLEEMALFQSDANSHFEASEMLSVPHLLSQTKEKTEFLLFKAPREAMREHLKELASWHLDPDIVSAYPLALAQYTLWRSPHLQDAYVIDLGFSEWTSIWIEKGELKKSYAVSGGIEALFSALWEDRKKILFKKEAEGFAKQINLLQFRTDLNPLLSHLLKEMRQDLAKSILSFHRMGGSKPIFFTGRVDAFGHFREYLLESFKDCILEEERRAIPTEELKHAISIGLAISGEERSIQLRREEFFPSKNWRRAGFFSLSLLLLSFFLSAFFLYIGKVGTERRQSEMIASLKTLLSSWDSPLQETIFSSDREETLRLWSKAVSSNAKPSPYLLQAPKAAEVLAWIHAHPLLQSLKKDPHPIDLISFHYQLTSFPNLDNLSDPYLAKVELTFQTTLPLHARKMHEALLKEEEWIDPSLEIQWQASEDLYHASFYLKNRSPHVP